MNQPKITDDEDKTIRATSVALKYSTTPSVFVYRSVSFCCLPIDLRYTNKSSF